MKKRAGQEDTICAISTAIGLAGIGVIRVSGENALKVVQPLFGGAVELAKIPSHTARYGQVIDPLNKKSVDVALFLVMRSPRSYTGEDVVEIQTHGSPLILNKILSDLLSQGARLAAPGEFTRRAFLSGRIDLVQAEAVMEVITAENWEHHEWALNQLKGTLSLEIEQLCGRLRSILAQIEASIDFSEEGILFWSHEKMLQEITLISDEVVRLLSGYEEGRKIRDGFKVVIIGRPNVGKSSLMNLLLNEDRAIVTPFPGTTRDLLHETVLIEGLSLQLTDTAGYRETTDLIEAEGVRRGEEALKQADLVLWVLDASDRLQEEDKILMRRLAGIKKMIVLNKADIPRRLEVETLQAENLKDPLLFISTVTGLGVAELKQKIKQVLECHPEKEPPLVALLRHKTALEAASKALVRGKIAAQQRVSWEFLAADLNEAIDSLGEIVGHTTPDEILDQIFNQFCIGK
ncbi:MAG: tRNA uridine-5-carboxymethylaminomethyl(34) synthesis GTPase MnmE [Candidatus Manganitrophaceae bacterium]